MQREKILFQLVIFSCCCACVTDLPKEDEEGRFRCERNDDCISGYECVDGFCDVEKSAEAQCGDGKIEGDEVCDGENLDSETCNTIFGMENGELACNADCLGFDGSGCYTCGNDEVDGSEECDGSDFDGADCLSVTGLEQGELICTDGCMIDSSDCHTCGNDQIEGPEICDGTDFGGESCASLQDFDGGTLACTEDCSALLTESCYVCGDRICEHESKGESTESCPEDCAWKQLSAGEYITCAVKNDGSAWCWGLDAYDRLGIGGESDREFQPRRVGGEQEPLTDIVRISASRRHTCAVAEDGSAWCWGKGDQGELGNGEMVDTSPLPVPVSALDNVLAITTGVHVTCAVTEDDDAWCWGLDWNGVLGTTEVDSGATTSTPLKVEFPEGVSIKDIVLSVGRDGPTACALSRAGSVYCWGSNGYGQVADGTTTHREMPTEVEGMSGGDRLSVGFYQFSLLKTEGSIHVWGNCEHCGCFGAEPVGGWDDCAGISCSMNPYEILSEDDGYAIADTASGVRGYAGFLDQSGSAWGWGRNAYGELGTGDNDGGDGLFCEVDGADWPYFEMPQQVALDVELTQVSFGHYHGCAIDVDGNAWCWGRNDDGELGIGRGNALDEFGGFECSFTPMKVLDPYGAE